MVSYNLKLIIFSIILVTLTLIYNNDYERLYKNMKYKNFVLVPINFRSLAEVSFERTTNHIYRNNKLREYGSTNEKKYQKNNYPKDDAKTEQNIPDVTEKENTERTNSKKHRKGTYDIDKKEKSNMSSRSLKYLEMQRKLYNNFNAKTEIYFEHFSNKSNDKSCECSNNKKTYNILNSSNKVHDNYLDNLNLGCVGAVNTCTFSSAFVGHSGIGAASSASVNLAATAAEGVLKSTYGISVSQLTEALTGVNIFNASSIQTAIISAPNTVTNFSLPVSVTAEVAAAKAVTAADAAVKAASGTAWGVFVPYGIATLVLILIVVVLIILYICLRKRRKKSWNHKYKNHLCT